MSQHQAENQPRRRRRPVDGLLLLDKPVGCTSNAALQRVKYLFHALKAGHTGSLDPLASGMLPLCFGQATKVSAYLLDADKTYRVRVRFGTRTDTADADGNIVAESEVRTVDRKALEQALDGLTGDILQVPPMYSALKKDGKRLYELARQGIEIERPPRPVTIHSMEIEAFDPGAPVIRVACSKGTYIRTLVEDLADKLGTLGHVAELRRLAVEPFTEVQLVTMEQIEVAAEAGDDTLDKLMISSDSALVSFPAVNMTREQTQYIRHGNPVQVEQPPQAGFCRIYDDLACFVGVGEAHGDGRIAPKRLFVAPESASG
ncbi:MAG: tRNA pseudouridine(55) synthase TruB [Gammaproteobacteria bacterium]|nr:tRNA pseudouridine(55) synthase TruB [Gammaproteobacteria bacterium]